jgi:hypothetical protein
MFPLKITSETMNLTDIWYDSLVRDQPITKPFIYTGKRNTEKRENTAMLPAEFEPEISENKWSRLLSNSGCDWPLHFLTITFSVVAEPVGSTRLIPKLANGHGPRSVPSSQPISI